MYYGWNAIACVVVDSVEASVKVIFVNVSWAFVNKFTCTRKPYYEYELRK
uniref:Uncharacterized protein n=1 Tax=Klebsiella pneumoniae TaxID=573 RepID=A0A1Y6M4D3_KLEPN|nr:Hypothetical protein [Klebsiella pneumoniae]SMY31442.1 hypothetical protein PKLPN57_380 [Klebsiella pneumoniae]